eukprot:COSAG02_NODE_6642_length_3441_cov_3.462597_5_plen_185_part_00
MRTLSYERFSRTWQRLTRAFLSAGVYAYGHVNATLSSLSLSWLIEPLCCSQETGVRPASCVLLFLASGGYMRRIHEHCCGKIPGTRNLLFKFINGRILPVACRNPSHDTAATRTLYRYGSKFPLQSGHFIVSHRIVTGAAVARARSARRLPAPAPWLCWRRHWQRACVSRRRALASVLVLRRSP